LLSERELRLTITHVRLSPAMIVGPDESVHDSMISMTSCPLQGLRALI
jgi:hypothetical protein